MEKLRTTLRNLNKTVECPMNCCQNRKLRRNPKPTELRPKVKENSKTDGVTIVDLSDRAETRDGVLERAAKDDSSTR